MIKQAPNGLHFHVAHLVGTDGREHTAWLECSCENGIEVRRYDSSNWHMTHAIAMRATIAEVIAGLDGRGVMVLDGVKQHRAGARIIVTAQVVDRAEFEAP